MKSSNHEFYNTRLKYYRYFFLSVEAIKLENFEKFRNRLSKYNAVLNPKIDWVDSDKDVENTYGCCFFFLIIILCFSPISFLITYKLFQNCLSIYYVVGITFLGTFIIWTFAIYAFEFIVKLLKLVENNVAQGTIGIIGFAILLISFICQYFSVK